MSDTKPPNPSAAESTLDHMEEELRELEGVGKSKWGIWLIVAIIAAGSIIAFAVRDRQSSSLPVSTAGATGISIDLQVPAKTKLGAPPPRFEWESISGRSRYRLAIRREGASETLIERSVRNSFAELTPEELQKLTPGAGYVWQVDALDQTGKTLGSGQSRFSL